MRYMFILDLIIHLQSSDGQKVGTHKTLSILDSYKMTTNAVTVLHPTHYITICNF
jgi:hypothetical protein